MKVFLSDLHLGHPMCKAGKLAQFLHDQDKNQTLVLVGDAIDDASVKHWPTEHLAAMREILGFSRIIYVPGNHDSFMSPLCGLWGGRVSVYEQFQIFIGDRRYLVAHGHRHDPTMSLVAPRWFRRTIPCTGRLHTKVMSGFLEWRMVRAAKADGCNGVICGHTHHPDNKMIDGVHYLNCGDWFYSCSAILENDGELKLVTA